MKGEETSQTEERERMFSRNGRRAIQDFKITVMVLGVVMKITVMVLGAVMKITVMVLGCYEDHCDGVDL